MASDSVAGLRPEDVVLAAVADAVEARGFAAEIWDSGWRLAYLTSDYARISNAGRDFDPVFFMIEARWFSTVRWLMQRCVAIFLLR